MVSGCAPSRHSTNAFLTIEEELNCLSLLLFYLFLYFIHLENNTLAKLKSNMPDSPYQKIPPYFSKRKKIYMYIYKPTPKY